MDCSAKESLHDPGRRKQLSAQLQSTDDAFNQRMADLTGSVKNSRIDLTKVKTDMSAKVDQAALDQRFNTEQKKWQNKIQALEKDINGQLKRIQQAIARIEKTIKVLETQRTTAPSVSPEPAAPPPQQPDAGAPSKPDTIIEKDL